MLRYSIDMKGVHLGKKEGFVQKVRTSNAYGKAILTRQRPVIGNRQFTEMFSDGFKI
ncbi:MAG: hypothetical protein US74_C0041G0015 [Parcubacteria group bacterium GW2011_GWA2_38_13]|nr:MAG: hypothetical protein US74_C0041G0015 [Parcubacteria group bacterium GW2011_GWA2_38_13]